jgi:hypothetical protein
LNSENQSIQRISTIYEQFLVIFLFVAVIFSFGEVSGLTRTAMIDQFTFGMIIRALYFLLSTIGLMGVLTDSKANFMAFLVICAVEVVVQILSISLIANFD